MIGFIVSGHGKFATGIESSIRLILGKPSQIAWVDFLETDTVESLEKKFQSAMETIEADSYLYLCDLAGGTPFKTAVAIKGERGDIEVVGGANIPMIAENIYFRESRELSELTEACVDVGRRSILSYKLKTDKSSISVEGI